VPIESEAALCNMALGHAGVRTRITSLDGPSVAAQQCKIYYAQYRDELIQKHAWPFATRRAALVPYAGSVWSAATTYALNDPVQYGSVVYKSLFAGNLNNAPPTSPAWWFQLTRDDYGYACPLPADFLSPIGIYPRPTGGSQVSSSQVGSLIVLRSDQQRQPFKIEDANDGTGFQVLLTDLAQPGLVYKARIENTMSFSTEFVKALAWMLAPVLCMALRADPKAAQVLEGKSIITIREAIADAMRGQRQDPEPISEFERAREN
jgi:hypothetical protein